jgi:hypothetical protein
MLYYNRLLILLLLTNIFLIRIIWNVHSHCLIDDNAFQLMSLVNFCCVIHYWMLWQSYAVIHVCWKLKCNIHIDNLNIDFSFFFFSIVFEDEYNLNPGLEWEDEFTGRSMFLLIPHPWLSCLIARPLAWPDCFTRSCFTLQKSQYYA